MATSASLPTQELPFYLSASTFTVTTNGVVSTGVSTVNVPITYFGPSIPLGPDDVWTFGGSTSPPPTTSTSTSTATPTSTSTSSTTTSSQITTSPTTTATPSSLTPAPTSGTNSLTSSSTTSSSPPTMSATASSGINLRRVLPGVIIAALVALLAIILILILWRYRRRRMTGMYHQPNISDFVLVDSEGQTRVAGTGAPRPTGGEEDPFLRRSMEGSDTVASPETRPPPRLVTPPPRTSSPEGARAIAKDAKTDSPMIPLRKDNPFFHASHSSLFFNPLRGPDPSVLVGNTSKDAKRESGSTQQSSGPSAVTGSILPTKQLMQMDGEWQSSVQAGASTSVGNIASRHGATEIGEREDYNTPLPPPPVLNPDGIPAATRTSTTRQSSQRNSVHTTLSLNRPDSPGSEPDERATLLTARRVQMDEGGRGTLMHAENAAIPSSWGSSLGVGLGGLTRLSRLSWFQRMESYRTGSPDSQQRWNSHRRSLSPNRSLQQRPQMAETTTSLPVSRSELFAPPRPLSHVSVASKSSAGDTVFHDARSTMSSRSLPAVASGSASAAPPLPPRTYTPESRSSPENNGGNGGTGSSSLPQVAAPGERGMISPAPHALSPLQHEIVPPSDDGQADTEVDILDMPVPAQLHTFSSASSRGGPMFPPGLEQHMADMNLSNVNLWRESSSDMPSAASMGSGSSGIGPSTSALGHTLGDNLDDAPPLPREGWMNLRSNPVNTVDSGRRTTLGQPVLVDLDEPNGGFSECGSLHSLAHVNPISASGSANSRAPSRGTFYGSSMGSGFSRRSDYANLSHSSRPHSHLGIGSPSLQHSNSVSSDGRRRPRRSPGEPASGSDSPYGSGQFARARLSAIGASSSMPQLSPFGGGFLSTSPSVPNMYSGSANSRSGSNLSGSSNPGAPDTIAEPDLDLVSPPPSALFSVGRGSDRLGLGSGIGDGSTTISPSTASRTATTMSDDGGLSTATSVTSQRTTVGECLEEEDIATAGYVPLIGAGSGPIEDRRRRERGRFPNAWMRAGDYV